MTILFSRRLAIFFGLLLPLGETARRWGTGGPLWLWLDDYIIGAFLLYGAWRCRLNVRDGQRYLAAAWAFACALGYVSFFSHLSRVQEPDVGHIPHPVLTTIIGVGWALAIWALVVSLKRLPEQERSRDLL